MRAAVVIGLALFASAAFAATPNATKIDFLFHNINLEYLGGPVTDLGFSFLIPDSAPDFASPENPSTAAYYADTTIFSAGETFQAARGIVQIFSSLDHYYATSTVYLVVTFPGDTYPGYSLNTQISEININLFDPTGNSAVTEHHADLLSDFAQRSTEARYWLRYGGSGAGQGTPREGFSPDAEFTSEITRVSTVPEPQSWALALAGLAVMAMRRGVVARAGLTGR